MNNKKDTEQLNIGDVSNSLLDKGRMLVEANTFADKCIRRTIFGKDRELAKQRLIVMYLLDEIDKLSKQ